MQNLKNLALGALTGILFIPIFYIWHRHGYAAGEVSFLSSTLLVTIVFTPYFIASGSLTFLVSKILSKNKIADGIVFLLTLFGDFLLTMIHLQSNFDHIDIFTKNQVLQHFVDIALLFLPFTITSLIVIFIVKSSEHSPEGH